MVWSPLIFWSREGTLGDWHSEATRWPTAFLAVHLSDDCSFPILTMTSTYRLSMSFLSILFHFHHLLLLKTQHWYEYLYSFRLHALSSVLLLSQSAHPAFSSQHLAMLSCNVLRKKFIPSMIHPARFLLSIFCCLPSTWWEHTRLWRQTTVYKMGLTTDKSFLGQ